MCLKRINLSFITPTSSLIPANSELVVELFLVECEIYLTGLLEILSIWKLFRKPSTLLIPVTLFLLEDDFCPVGLLKNFLSEAEQMVAVQTFLEVVHTRTDFAMWVSLWLDGLFFFVGSSLEPDLSSWVGGKQNYTPCPKDEGMHLLLYCLGLVYMQFIKEVGGWLWMQTDTELVVSCLLRSLGKLKHLVSILNYPWHFMIPSLHVHLEHWEGTPQALRFVCWEGNSK